MELPFELNQKIVEFLTSIPNIYDKNRRTALIISASLDKTLEGQIKYEGESIVFFQFLVRTLTDFGKLKDGRNALEAVLEAAKQFVGPEGKESCDILIEKLRLLGSSDDFPSSDPTKPLEKPPGLPVFYSSDELEENFSQLKQERILVISCFDEKILLSAAYAIVEKPELETYQKRLLSFDGDNSERSDLNLGIFTSQKIGRGEKLIVVINIKSQLFFDSMFFEFSSAQNIKGELKRNDIMLICLIDSVSMQETLEKNKSNFYFPHWPIFFLPHLLQQYFPKSESKAGELEKKILEQRGNGLWGERCNESEFYEIVYAYLQKGAEQLQKEIEKREGYPEEQDPEEFLKSIEKIKPNTLFNIEELLKSTVLYVATFFPELSPCDFDEMVSLLLRDQKRSVEVESWIVTENGEKKVIKTQVEEELIKSWQEKPDITREECQLETIQSENSSQFIEFSLPLRKELKRFLEQRYSTYLRQQFECIKGSGLLFDFNASSKIIESAIRLTAAMLVFEPNYYGKHWLNIVVTGIKRQLRIDIELDDNEFEQLIQLVANIEEDKIRRQIFVRLSGLIREMLNYQPLQETIRHFLESLIRTKHYDVALEIVLEITKRLQFAPQFNTLYWYWMKQLLDRGSEETRTKTYKSLLGFAKQNSFRIFELLENIKKWLPEMDREPGKYSRSNQYALKFMIDYCDESRFSPANYGEWPSKYPLFASIQENDILTETKLEILTSWILNPGIKYVYDDADNIIADLIEEWFTILRGLKKDTFHPKALEISDLLLRQIILTADRFQRKELLEKLFSRWRSKKMLYLEEISKLDYTQRAQREQLRHKRELVKELVERFKQLRQQTA